VFSTCWSKMPSCRRHSQPDRSMVLRPVNFDEVASATCQACLFGNLVELAQDGFEPSQYSNLFPEPSCPAPCRSVIGSHPKRGSEDRTSGERQSRHSTRHAYHPTSQG
jgi:hypothetical protein